MLRFSIYINYLHGRYRVWEEIMEDRNDLQQVLSEIDAALNLDHLDETRADLLEGPKAPEDLFSASAS